LRGNRGSRRRGRSVLSHYDDARRQLRERLQLGRARDGDHIGGGWGRGGGLGAYGANAYVGAASSAASFGTTEALTPASQRGDAFQGGLTSILIGAAMAILFHGAGQLGTLAGSKSGAGASTAVTAGTTAGDGAGLGDAVTPPGAAGSPAPGGAGATGETVTPTSAPSAPSSAPRTWGGAAGETTAADAPVAPAAPPPQGGTTTFFRGMTYGEASEAVEAQGFNPDRIAANQTLNPGAAGSGAYLTTQEATAAHYAQLAGMQGRGLGPAIVRVDVPSDQFNLFVQTHNLDVETLIPRGPFPGATETLIPMEHIETFNAMGTFTLHF
jgi:hypothetical protein